MAGQRVAVFERRRGRAAALAVLFQPVDCRIFLAVLRAAEIVGRRGAADPEADFNRPGSEPAQSLSFEFERADEAGGALELIEGQKPQRVAHDDRQARAPLLTKDFEGPSASEPTYGQP